MRDPQVVALHYRLETGPQFAFKDPDPVEHKTAAFSLRLVDGHLRAEIKDDPATVTDAFGELTQFLRSWVILHNLRNAAGVVKLRFERTEVVDGPPGADISDVLRSLLAPKGRITLSVRGRRTLTQHPELPERFVASPEVVDMWGRYEGSLGGKEPVPLWRNTALTESKRA